MCLRPLFGDTIGEIAHKPIKCYKVYYKEESGKLQALVSKEIYEGIEGDVIEAKETVVPSLEMSIGFIHAYTEPYSLLLMLNRHVCAVDIECEISGINYNINEYVDYEKIDENLTYLKQSLNTDICLCEMEIPTEERYWKGVCGDICARRMILKKRLVWNKSDILKMIQDYFKPSRESVRMKYEKLIEKYKAKGE